LNGEIEGFLGSKKPLMMAQLESFVRHETPSDEKDLLDGFGEKISGAAAELLDIETEVIRSETSGNHVVLRKRASGGKQILILGHFDTVWPRGTIDKMPYAVRGDTAHGPGVFDMKSGLVIGLWALKALQSIAELPAFTFLMNSDEEIGSPSSRPLIEREAKRSKAVLVLEPSEGGAVKTARKGVGMFRIEVKGRAAHAGLDFFEGVSAIRELAKIIEYLYTLVDEKEGITVNVGVVRGGTRSNVVADSASAEVDLRVWTPEQAKTMIPRIVNLKPHNPSVRIAVTGEMNRPPMPRTQGAEELFMMAKRLASKAGYRLKECSVGGGSDGNFCTAVGASVLDGLGAVGDGAHAASEHIVISSLVQRSGLLANLIRELAV
jgi:glutamate carboxypeptidase